MTTCLVTGARGLVGSHVVRRLTSDGVRVISAVREPRNVDERHFRLGESLDIGLFEGVDAVAHCAYDFRAHSWAEIEAVNVNGSAALIAGARRSGVERICFVSSVGAYPGCRSLYGQGKVLVERIATDAGGTVVRPGLVYGDPSRGVFGALARASRLPLLVLPGGGWQPLVLVHADDLAAALSEVLARARELAGATVVAAQLDRLALRQILASLARRSGRQPRFISFPPSLALAGLHFAERCRLPLRFRSDNLLGLLYPNPAVDFGATAYLAARFRRFLVD